ncbi:MAG: hypothetical protein JWR63_184 [Conexibacter sp.]|nr:hypothetical protein [Conexibacter sp.]
MVARRLLVLTVFAVLLAPAGASAGDSLVGFQLPSKKIACVYSHFEGEKAALRCDVADVVRPAKRPASCKLDYGSAFGLTATGKGRRLCAGDTVLDPKAKVLAYGASRTLGPFTCASRTTGLRCTTRAGHGFELSRTRQGLF